MESCQPVCFDRGKPDWMDSSSGGREREKESLWAGVEKHKGVGSLYCCFYRPVRAQAGAYVRSDRTVIHVSADCRKSGHLDWPGGSVHKFFSRIHRFSGGRVWMEVLFTAAASEKVWPADRSYRAGNRLGTLAFSP